ncbi:aminomethyl-transferring glycine dehydrogenase [Candidatus Woesearchaeota archaeon CG11_big_fil_rev_8_21_14_0_20_43_8]|nr:MAG: aminomethyl-transferring glycine dehydrogenase [Candidatus Woesearchaeota archaeon CG11_big_fil_rev_8_21_14_0_20_43_8]PIO05312.1 MAG: aminomethyl-transferring glycine dehydrogenase [Candidatus Woesearchaeota archaeon CG08_land_8_20_14_0_20_43_7]
MDFIPLTDEAKQEMLSSLGISSISGLDLPESILLGLEKGIDEIALRKAITKKAMDNSPGNPLTGAGAYRHFIPATVDFITTLPAFKTAYTPYQAEISQGTLTAIFEFQTYMCELTGMDVANASMYDGATAMAESALMTLRKTGKKKVLVSRAVHPHYRRVLATYLQFTDSIIQEIGCNKGVTDLCTPDEDTACIIIQTPNFFGCLEELKRGDIPLIAVVNEATSLALLDTSAADIVCGEAQSFGNTLSFGGPYLGFIACKKDYLRLLPGRIVGKTTDTEGKDGFVLTLQAREQHIRREKATSNICSNEALCALAATVHLSTLGGSGLLDIAKRNVKNARHLKDQLQKKGIEVVFDNPFYNEFMIRTDLDIGYALWSDYPELSGCRLVCATEIDDKDKIDIFIETIK